VTLGYHGDPRYRWYSAYRNLSGTYADFAGALQSQDGSSHLYTVVAGYVWSATIDGSTQLAVGNMGNNVCTSETGLEVFPSLDGNSGAVPTGAGPLFWLDNGLTWHTPWSGDWWITSPCGTPPYCLTGGYYPNTNQWISSKPLF
jgi:hypothetical protein